MKKTDKITVLMELTLLWGRQKRNRSINKVPDDDKCRRKLEQGRGMVSDWGMDTESLKEADLSARAEGGSHVGVRGRNIPGRGRSKCKGPEVSMCLACLRKQRPR